MSVQGVRLARFVLLTLAYVGCAREATAPPAEQRLVAPEGEVVLDVRADGATLEGRVEAVPVGSDAERVIVIERAPQGFSALVGARVLDARFVLDRVVSVGVDHVLRAHDAEGGVAELDRQAEAPLSVAGSTVAYARGEMPFFELARADVSSMRAEVLTEGMAPVWSPALDAETGAIVFVSAREGAPRLHRWTGGQSTPLPRTARAPSSPLAPRLEGDRLRFEDEAGEVVIELSTGRVLEERGL
jgi:hypothetical protein